MNALLIVALALAQSHPNQMACVTPGTHIECDATGSFFEEAEDRGAGVIDHIWNFGEDAYHEVAPVGADVVDQRVAGLIFVGASRYSALTGDEFCVQATTDSADSIVELYDVTNTALVGSIELPSGTALTCDPDGLSNVPVARAFLEFQASVLDGDSLRVDAAYWVRVPTLPDQGGFRAPLWLLGISG